MDQVLEENKNMIYSIARYFRNYKLKEDLFQAGCIGLFKAYNKFNPDMGVKFSTYAFPSILGEMKKLVREDKGIKISREITSLNSKIEEAKIFLTQNLLREPTKVEIANYLEEEVEDIEEAILSNNCLQSFDYVINANDGEKDLTFYDIIGNNLNIDMILELKEQLDMLDPIERKIILARYVDDLTQTETANILGMNQVQVSRKESKVITKIRTNLVA